MKRLTLGLVLFALAALGLVIGASAGSPYTFDGAPPAPAAYSDPHLDVQVHSRDGGQGLAMVAQHGADCAAPPATHAINGGSVFQCANHLMTAINDDGYGEIILTPDTMLDFSSGGTVQFEVSTFKASIRDWWSLTVTPWAENQALPLVSSLSQGVDLQDEPKNAVNIANDSTEDAPLLTTMVNGSRSDWNAGWNTPAINDGVTAGTNTAAVRQTFKLTLTKTHVRFERLASATAAALVYIDQNIPALAFTQGVVQFGHHSYNPTKNGAGVPGTWHWDNFAISPGVPFTMTKPVVSGDTVTTGAGMLRFAAICEVSLDGLVLTPQIPTTHPDHYTSYFVPVTAGTHTLTFAPDDWYSGPCGWEARGANVWVLGAQSATVTPVPPTSTATPTNTVAPTSTPTVAPTSTPTVAPPTPTPTPTPAKYRCQRQNANGSWTTLWTKVGGGSCP